jgi:hypothetical protein
MRKLPVCYLKQAKMSVFFFFKTGEQYDRTSPVWDVGTVGWWEDVGKGCGRLNIVKIMCTHACKLKNDTC